MEWIQTGITVASIVGAVIVLIWKGGASMSKIEMRLYGLEKRMDKFEIRLDRLEQEVNKIRIKLGRFKRRS